MGKGCKGSELTETEALSIFYLLEPSTAHRGGADSRLNMFRRGCSYNEAAVFSLVRLLYSTSLPYVKQCVNVRHRRPINVKRSNLTCRLRICRAGGWRAFFSATQEVHYLTLVSENALSSDDSQQSRTHSRAGNIEIPGCSKPIIAFRVS